MIHAMDVAALLPSQATVTAVPRPAGLPAAWPAQVRNAPLPARMREAPASAPATASWRRLLLAVATLVSVGTVMYWTFGKPVFLAPSPSVDPDPQAAVAARAVDWKAVDRILRRALG